MFRVGDAAPKANLVKLSGNFMILSAVEAMAEAMTLAEKGGVPREMLLEVLTGTLRNACGSRLAWAAKQWVDHLVVLDVSFTVWMHDRQPRHYQRWTNAEKSRRAA